MTSEFLWVTKSLEGTILFDDLGCAPSDALKVSSRTKKKKAEKKKVERTFYYKASREANGSILLAPL